MLCGGSSRRMGRDKAVLDVGGQAMAVRVALALEAAGATDVVALGGDRAALEALGLVVVDDAAPGGGPLPATIQALRRSVRPIVVVLSCDLITPSATAVAATVAELVRQPEAAAAVPLSAEQHQWTHAAWRVSVAEPGLTAAQAAGARSLKRASVGLSVIDVEGLDPSALADADSPADLPGSLPPDGRA